jgi:hypothetical protein
VSTAEAMDGRFPLCLEAIIFIKMPLGSLYSLSSAKIASCLDEKCNFYCK